MTISTDSARRPLYVDRRSGRFFADPLIGGGAWPEVSVSLAQLGTLPANTLLGRQGTSGTAGTLSADVTIDLLNTATTQTLNAARVVAASTTGAGVVQLFDGTGSTSTALAATANSVRLANDLATTANANANTANATANAALARGGGTMTGAITFAAGQTFPGAALLAAPQTFTAAQRGTVSALGAVSGTVTLNFASANHFSMDFPAGGTVVLGDPSNLVPGQSGCIVITQNATTAASISYGSVWRFQGGAQNVSLSTGSVNLLTYFVESATRVTADMRTNTIA